MSYDMIIQGGMVVDGTGNRPFKSDVGIKDGVIEKNLDGEAGKTLHVDDRIVTPGFVDIHTHYDGQVTWDSKLDPSSGHGVTTVVMGNCGVGFAPVRPGQEDWLIQLMEGVEDIPGTALSEGMNWGWETFPQYLESLDEGEFAIDVGTQIAHGAVRAYVMGERGSKNQPASSEDISQMKAMVQEAIESGALGVSTSRVLGHRAMDGEPVPGTFAAEDELYGLGEALRDAGSGVFELAPAGADGQDLVKAPSEMEWMKRLSSEIDRPVTFAMLQNEAEPDLWKQLLEESLRACEQGSQCFPQVAGRPFGLLIGLQTHHAFAKRPTFAKYACLPHEELVAELKQSETRGAILSEEDMPMDSSVLFDGMARLVQGMTHRLFPLGEIPDYEPAPDASIVAIAERLGTSPLEVLYDYMLEDDGHAMAMMPIFNYVSGNHDAIREMLLHPQSVSGLEWVIKKHTNDTASLYGLKDRGTIEVGKRADINVINFDALNLSGPRMVHDLPAGGRRLLQEAHGYEYTIVAGAVTRDHGEDTGARPGRLIRGTR
jgi:N-acyl-D-amino-acid deacylase